MNQDIDAELIWKDLHEELYRFILHKIKDSSLTEDLLQDVFIKVHLNIHQLNDAARLTSWVYQITRNVIYDHYRKTQLSSSGSFTLDEDDSKESLYAALSTCINGKIQSLSSKDRQAVVLTYFRNYNQKQLADFLNISYSGAKNRVQRVRKKIQTAILACPNVEVSSSGEIRRIIS